MTIVGTRPELIKMSKVITEFDALTNHVLVHTGQNYDYELNEIFFHDLGIKKPSYYLDSAEKTPSITIGNIIRDVDKVLEKINPDALLIRSYLLIEFGFDYINLCEVTGRNIYVVE